MLQSYYDSESPRYDRTRGGEARAAAAAAAILELLPSAARTVLDVAGGTGIVGARLGRRVISLDRSFGMATVAASRLPGRVVLGDAARLPVASHSVDAVTTVWLLHLLNDAAEVIAGVARVLRPGGVFITTVDKSAAHYETEDDVGAVLGPVWRATHAPATDSLPTVTALADRHGLALVGETTFTGVGQARGPAGWIEFLADPMSGWLARCGADRVAELRKRLAALPDQTHPRSQPTYHLVAFTG